MTNPTFLIELLQGTGTDELVQEIISELKKAESKHPEWPGDVIHASAILNEEAGELTRACLQKVYEKGNWADVRKEAVQTAAMAIRFLKNFPLYNEII